MNLRVLVFSIGIFAVTGSAALAAQPNDRGNTPGLGFGRGGNHQISIGDYQISFGDILSRFIDRNDNRGGWGGSGGDRPKVVGVPGPVAGVGLPLAAVGFYFWRRASRKPKQ
ncbi:MAG: hypothetical protein JWN11_1874 [Hyphomicrobiales bacterium]|nr:hypothetical protein [Hyphomicrobiales bacterium]